MDLSYGSEMDSFREEVRLFLAESWPPSGDEKKRSRAEQLRRFRERAVERGYLCRNIPKRYGGSEQEPDVLKSQVIREEFRNASAPMEPPGIGTMMLVPTLLERGEEWQKEKFVRATILGELTWCQGYSEPGSGSDLASLKTRGELVGDEWVINGQKIWTSSAQDADYMFCLVRTEPDAQKHAGISYLLIDMKQPGIEVRPLRQMTGQSDFNEVFLNDVRTPEDWIVGKRGEGWLVSRTTLKHERNSIGAASQSVELFEALVELAKERLIDGRPGIERPDIRRALVELEGYVRSHAYSGYLQLTRDVKGESPGILAMMNKLNSTNIGHKVARIGMELIDEDGLVGPGERSQSAMGPPLMSPGSWVSQYMWSLGIAIAGGTANIQRNVIAERGLGLPRDAAAQRSK
ncbi:MAG: acyl-CoA dehydrogenase family protein [Deltaproteobacteria bacterium]|jgi:alkylation response protein AidB-like acyl-CoA dehydrogenase|nr:acyl-CoA dehydrogenase family protein [Deltaproteobacteria bacterium]